VNVLVPGGCFWPGPEEAAWSAALEEANGRKIVSRLWKRDASLWKDDPRHVAIIENALGWLTVAETMRLSAREIQKWAAAVGGQGLRQVVLCGMGGSSLAPEVFAGTFPGAPGLPLLVLDSTSPEQIRKVESRIDVARTFFLISSKSGGTLETLTHFKYFFAKVASALGSKEDAGKRFAAITDPGSRLEDLARKFGFDRVFLNFPDIGGRYSALSYFGLVPAALCGIDLARMLESVRRAMAACRIQNARENPGACLGAALSALARRGRDKVTFVCSPRIGRLGAWLEQLIAESTGKEGLGIVPVEGEPLATPADYGNDRFFVYERLRNDSDGIAEKRLDRLRQEGQPVAAFSLDRPEDLAGRMFIWEFATAVAGSLLKIDAFDQPNVQESKDNTGAVLKAFEDAGRLDSPSPDWSREGIDFFGPGLAEFLAGARRGKDYVALMAYAERSPENEETLTAVREEIRDATGCATTVGFGPRFLHSTGQLHKGGPDEGVFLQFVAPGEDLPIPDSRYGFATFLRAQALGDENSLRQRGRRFLKAAYAGPSAEGLARLALLVSDALSESK
jgi:glucose-6-phosphate isomerase